MGLTKNVLWCLLCGTRFGMISLLDGTYLADTGICKTCYRKMQEDQGTCFGKKSEGRVLGYDEEAIECNEFCPDKKVCRSFEQSISSGVRAGKVV